MQIRHRGKATTSILMTSVSATVLAVGGCAHHRADQYSYAPPYAPPVYPQPGVQPVAYPAPSTAVAGAAVPQAAIAAAPAMPPATGEVVLAAGSPCPPCAAEGMAVGATTIIEGGGQTPPCPPAH